MSLARTLAVALTGMDGRIVEVECDIAAGLPGLSFTGLPDTSVSESRDRLRAAVVNSGAEWPNRKITVALLPADLRKSGSRFDLAIGVAVLAAAGQVPPGAVGGCLWLAELGLSGRLRPVRGVLPAILTARAAGVRRVVVARANAAEAALVPDMEVRSADGMGEIIGWLTGSGAPLPITEVGGDSDDERRMTTERAALPCLSDVAGQPAAKRALELAAAGGHHLCMIGVPGAGKTMLAERLPGLLPPLTDAQSLDVTAVQSVAGTLPSGAGLVRRPPMQAPHHTASLAALVGGGPGLARPGAISLAHHGVLFLDEAPEFGARTLDALRQPLEDGVITLHRSGGSVRYPARFQLVLAANPCPCAQTAARCECQSVVRRRYRQRLSGPLLDRIDVNLAVDAVQPAHLYDPVDQRETTAEVARRVAQARAAAAERWAGFSWSLNAHVPGSRLRQGPWRLPSSVTVTLDHHLRDGSLTARGCDRVLRMAWSFADLNGHGSPTEDDVAESVFYRIGQGMSWAA